jgi:hypothetical protein
MFIDISRGSEDFFTTLKLIKLRIQSNETLQLNNIYTCGILTVLSPNCDDESDTHYPVTGLSPTFQHIWDSYQGYGAAPILSPGPQF